MPANVWARAGCWGFAAALSNRLHDGRTAADIRSGRSHRGGPMPARKRWNIAGRAIPVSGRAWARSIRASPVADRQRPVPAGTHRPREQVAKLRRRDGYTFVLGIVTSLSAERQPDAGASALTH